MEWRPCKFRQTFSALRRGQSLKFLTHTIFILFYALPVVPMVLIRPRNGINRMEKNQDKYIPRRLSKCFTAEGSLHFIP